MGFRLRQMEAFRAVMMTGSMNGAARLLNISQPAVSRLVAHTEQTLELRLFDRDRGKLTPTAEAELLFKEVGALFEEVVRIDEFARDLSCNPAGALRLCSSPSLALNFMPPLVASYLRGHPQLRVKFHTTLLANMAHELLSRKAELAVSVLPIEHPNLVVEPFASGRMVCISPHGHPLAQLDQVPLAEFTQYPFIAYSRSIPFGQLMTSAFERANVTWRPSIEIVRAESACAFVRDGAGVAIVDEFSVGGGGWPGVVVRPLSEVIPLTLSLLRSRFDRPSLHVRELSRLIRQHARSQGRGLGDET
jgi:DNA-binding transcriptional LysR family regulator